MAPILTMSRTTAHPGSHLWKKVPPLFDRFQQKLLLLEHICVALTPLYQSIHELDIHAVNLGNRNHRTAQTVLGELSGAIKQKSYDLLKFIVEADLLTLTPEMMSDRIIAHQCACEAALTQTQAKPTLKTFRDYKALRILATIAVCLTGIGALALAIVTRVKGTAWFAFGEKPQSERKVEKIITQLKQLSNILPKTQFFTPLVRPSTSTATHHSRDGEAAFQPTTPSDGGVPEAKGDERRRLSPTITSLLTKSSLKF